MRKVLELIRAAIVVSAMPVVIMFYAASTPEWFVGLGIYVAVATLALVTLNHVLKEKPGEARASPEQ
jgi:hypothetical protein